MHIPLWSSITLGTELLVTAFVYFIIYGAYQSGVFRKRIAFGVLAYELLFNITYMASRFFSSEAPVSRRIVTPYETGLAIFHGTFSLLMFVALVAFFLSAYYGYERGSNYFREHGQLTSVFCAAWLISILSGVFFFIALYLS